MQPPWLVELFDVAKKSIDVLDPDTRDYALPAHAPIERVVEILEKGDLATGPRCEVAVSALGWNRPVMVAVPDQQPLAKPRACRDQPPMATPVRPPALQPQNPPG